MMACQGYVYVADNVLVRHFLCTFFISNFMRFLRPSGLVHSNLPSDIMGFVMPS